MSIVKAVLAWLGAHGPWLFSGVGVVAAGWLVQRIWGGRHPEQMRGGEQKASLHVSEPPRKFYRHELGDRHRQLRTEILGIDVRRMSDFYGYDEAAELERYEAGEGELPRHSLRRLEEFFFVRDDYFRGATPSVFQTLYIHETGRVASLLEQGFKVHLFCCPDNREDLLALAVLHKVENGMDRSIAIRPVGSLSPYSGGGAGNIHQLIQILVRCQIPKHQVLVLRASEEMWEQLMEDRFYLTGTVVATQRTDSQAALVFQEWYTEA